MRLFNKELFKKQKHESKVHEAKRKRDSEGVDINLNSKKYPKTKLQQHTPEYQEKLFKHKKSRLKMRKQSQRINRARS